jgi:SAM-dependent methyltransferase
MMSRSERGDTFCDTDCFELVRDQVFDRFEVIDGVYCFSSADCLNHPASLRAVRYLDRFYVLSDLGRPGSDLAPERVLFDVIASEYDSDVDTTNNIKTADALLRMTGASRIVDLGCGTGLALRAPAAAKCELLGLDASPHMLAIARGAGMDTASLEDIASVPGGFDGLISCYALHLHGPRLALIDAVHLLADTSRIAANFHKGVGYSEVSSSLRTLGFSPVEELHHVDGLASPVALWGRA